MKKVKNTNKDIKDNYKVPKDYFNSFENKIYKKLKFYKSKPFSVPDSYFDSIENSVLHKIKKKEGSKFIVFPLKQRIIKYIIPLGIAASFILFSGILFFSNPKVNFNNLTQTDIENWLDIHLEDVNSYTIDNAYEDVYLEDLSSILEEELLYYLKDTSIENLDIFN